MKKSNIAQDSFEIGINARMQKHSSYEFNIDNKSKCDASMHLQN